jgi:hypothetical protein
MTDLPTHLPSVESAPALPEPDWAYELALDIALSVMETQRLSETVMHIASQLRVVRMRGEAAGLLEARAMIYGEKP